MIRIDDIRKGLAHLVGWEQAIMPSEQVAEELTESESGLYYQSAHPMLTLKNVRSIMPEMDVNEFPKWKKTDVYAEGQIVEHGGKLWQATQASEDEEPADGSEYWSEYDAESIWLQRMQDTAITQMIQRFLATKSLLKESKQLLERRTFFDGAGRINNTLKGGQRLVGFEIIPAYAMGVTAKVERIGLQMTGATGTVRLYLFHSSQVDPIAYQDLEFTKTNGGFQWFDMKDWYMPYISDKNDSGGAWYIVYDQAALPEGMECINVAKDWSREPCGTCNIGSVEAWRELTKYLSISPFRVPSLETFAEYPELWDIAQNVYTNTVNYGLNVEVTVSCDLTDFIIRERQMFATVLQKEMAARLLKMMAFNPSVRVNRNQSNASQFDIMAEVDGIPQGMGGTLKKGLAKELENAYNALDLDTRGIDRLCLTCRPVGVRYTTA